MERRRRVESIGDLMVIGNTRGDVAIPVGFGVRAR